MTAEEIMNIQDVKERIEKYVADEPQFIQMLKDNTKVFSNALVIDLRNEETIYCGNRFMIYTLFPDCNVSIRVIWGFKRQNVVFTVGHSITNRTSKTDIGKLMLSFGGGGHKAVGTCQVPEGEVSETLKKIVDKINADG